MNRHHFQVPAASYPAQLRPAQELEERATQDEREVRRVPEKVVTRL